MSRQEFQRIEERLNQQAAQMQVLMNMMEGFMKGSHPQKPPMPFKKSAPRDPRPAKTTVPPALLSGKRLTKAKVQGFESHQNIVWSQISPDLAGVDSLQEVFQSLGLALPNKAFIPHRVSVDAYSIWYYTQTITEAAKIIEVLQQINVPADFSRDDPIADKRKGIVLSFIDTSDARSHSVSPSTFRQDKGKLPLSSSSSVMAKSSADPTNSMQVDSSRVHQARTSHAHHSKQRDEKVFETVTAQSQSQRPLSTQSIDKNQGLKKYTIADITTSQANKKVHHERVSDYQQGVAQDTAYNYEDLCDQLRLLPQELQECSVSQLHTWMLENQDEGMHRFRMSF